MKLRLFSLFVLILGIASLRVEGGFCDPNPCNSENATCLELPDGYDCFCPEGFSDHFCDVPVCIGRECSLRGCTQREHEHFGPENPSILRLAFFGQPLLTRHADVTVKTSIQYPHNEDLVVTLTTPTHHGFFVLTNSSGGQEANGFDGTVWSNRGNYTPVDYDWQGGEGEVAPFLHPQVGAFSRLRFAQIVGIWELAVVTKGEHEGESKEFSVELHDSYFDPCRMRPCHGGICTSSGDQFTCTTPNPCTYRRCTAPAAMWLRVNDQSPTARSQVVFKGLPIHISDRDLIIITTNIRHQNSKELVIYLVSPKGTRAALVIHHGAKDSFLGTQFSDCEYYSAGTFDYPTYGVVPYLKPQMPFSKFKGENPNGAWTLVVSDQTSGNKGYLESWTLTFADIQACPIHPCMQGHMSHGECNCNGTLFHGERCEKRNECPYVFEDDIEWVSTYVGDTASGVCLDKKTKVTRNCLLNGKWANVRGKCPHCPKHNYQHAHWENTKMDQLANGTCHVGWIGNPQRQCFHNNTWSKEVINPCVEIQCPAIMDNLTYWNASVPHGPVKGHCMFGYFGHPKRACKHDGTWSDRIFGTCIRCEEETYANAHWPASGKNTLVHGTCLPGYVGNPKRKCMPKGRWKRSIYNPCHKEGAKEAVHGHHNATALHHKNTKASTHQKSAARKGQAHGQGVQHSHGQSGHPHGPMEQLHLLHQLQQQKAQKALVHQSEHHDVQHENQREQQKGYQQAKHKKTTAKKI